MTILCLVRHGQTAWNLEGRWQGHTDISLDETGLQQAQQVALALRDTRFDALYTSDLIRALVTARAIAGLQPGLDMRIDPRLREIGLGQWEGQLLSEIPVLYPLEWAERDRNPLDYFPPGGESVRQVAVRVQAALREICAAHPHDLVLLVSHGLALAVLLCCLEDRPLFEAYSRVPANASPIFVECRPGLGSF
jgi:probable phosphoglycerate mutase